MRPYIDIILISKTAKVLSEKKTTDQELSQEWMQKFAIKYHEIESNNMLK
jgi:hypothetical protein